MPFNARLPASNLPTRYARLQPGSKLTRHSEDPVLLGTTDKSPWPCVGGDKTRKIGICCADHATRALLRRAAEKATFLVQSLDPQNAISWLTAHPDAYLVLEHPGNETNEILLDFGLFSTSALRRVIVLQSIEDSAGDAAKSKVPFRTSPQPRNDVDALALVEHLLTTDTAEVFAALTPRSGPTADDLDTNHVAFETALRLAQFPVDLLLIGETGSGKDSLAKYIYRNSAATGAFIPVNCAAVPEHLAEAELFGFEAGSFTGAVRAKPGKFEEADKGLLYLDEVDSCPLWLQAKLLRVLQEKGSERVGSSRFRPSDFRLVASTKADLLGLVEKGLFREDLYFRLNVIEIHLPPIRDQPEKLQALFQRFLAEACQRFNIEDRACDSATLAALLQRQWLGNIRELKSEATRHALALVAGDSGRLSGTKSLQSALDSYEKALISATLVRNRGSVRHAASDLRTPVNTMYYRMKRLGIENR